LSIAVNSSWWDQNPAQTITKKVREVPILGRPRISIQIFLEV
jgi:hypothetical protein